MEVRGRSRARGTSPQGSAGLTTSRQTWPARTPGAIGILIVRPVLLLRGFTRFRILHAVTDRARPTQELAPLVGLSEPATSRHLSVLTRSGLVSSLRDGHYVLYRACPERLAAVQEALREYLAQERVSRERSGRRASASS